MPVPFFKILGKLSFLILFAPALAFAQSKEGIPFIKNYYSNQYKESPENWAVAQDQRGVMYFGNASGVLTYDGVKWRLVPVSNNSLVRSVDIDKHGLVYVGAVGEFGVLEPDSNGFMTYRSLVQKLPPAEREFADVWKTYVTPEGVYFQTFSKLIRVSGNEVKIWKPETSFHFSYYLDGKFFINEREKGLKQMSGNRLMPVPGAELFAALRIYSMLPYANNKILVATREKGLCVMDLSAQQDSVFKFLACEANSHLIDNQVYGGAALGNGRYAFATLKKGVFITDERGAIVQTLNKELGLADDIIKSVATDRANDLWLALGNGIAHVEISSPITTINDALGLKGTVQDISYHRGYLYVATSLGVYIEYKGRFTLVKGITSQTLSLKEFCLGGDTILLASSENGVFKIEKDESVLLQPGFGYFIYQSGFNPARVYVGMNDGLLSLRYENKRWINEDYLDGIEEEIRSVAEDEHGNLWLGTPFNGLLRISFNEKKDTLFTAWKTSFDVKRYDTLSGLPGLKYNIPYDLKGKTVFATVNGIYEFDTNTDRFFLSSFLKDELKDHQIFRIASKDNSSIWLVTVAPDGKKETGVGILQKDGSYVWYTQPFRKVFERELHAVYPGKNITWLGGPDGLLHYDAAVKKDFAQPFYALIRTVICGKDSIFGGSFPEAGNEEKTSFAEQPDFMRLRIPFDKNSIQFEYAAPSFSDEKNTLFSIYLEGYDNDWSDWSNKTEKEYTNLKEGKYTFRVKAKNIYGAESIGAGYSFTILAPWYRTVWAYIAYVILFVGIVYQIIRLSIRRLVRAKIKLEGVVKERTAEVVHQKHLIEEKQKEIIDSINYAQRIQRALLASEKLLNDNLPDNFVLFQPKDIVSGDFYWGATLADGCFALVTADSTGHGVPGAIMSMLNISCLNEAVSGQNLAEPDEIMNYTRSRVIRHLANDGSAEGGKDGMDCSLVCLDLKSNKLTYAAANNPLWLVRNKQIFEYDPDKMPVGKHDRDTIPFARHEVELQKGDMIYTSTDGMPDQFGGPRGKKFMYKQLKELFVSVSDLPLAEQKEKIKQALNNWKGELEQVDDVCIIGVRI